jgi:hypothetical protein
VKPFALLAAPLFLAIAVAAQDTTAGSGAQQEGAPRHVLGIDVFPTPGKPFSGRDCIDTTTHSASGSAQKVHLDGALVARDKRGRVYREIRVWFPATPAPRSRLDYIILLDPMAHTRTECKVAARSCTIATLTPSPGSKPSLDGPFDAAPYYLHRVSLGSDVIEGVVVEGTRITSSLNAGVFVNNEAPVENLDFWHSHDLEIDLSVTRTYKDGTERVVHVVNLSRSEPDPALFQIPVNFAVVDVRRPTKPENSLVNDEER